MKQAVMQNSATQNIVKIPSLFSDMDVSQGSSGTHVRCGGIVNDDFVAYFIANLPVKEF